jgi:hypothetical protein
MADALTARTPDPRSSHGARMALATARSPHGKTHAEWSAQDAGDGKIAARQDPCRKEGAQESRREAHIVTHKSCALTG